MADIENRGPIEVRRPMIVRVPVTIRHDAEFAEIHGSRPREIRVEGVIFREPLDALNLQSVVAARGTVAGIADALTQAVFSKQRPARIEIARTGNSGVQIVTVIEIPAHVAHVSHLQHHTFRELSRHRKIPCIHVWILEVGGNIPFRNMVGQRHQAVAWNRRKHRKRRPYSDTKRRDERIRPWDRLLDQRRKTEREDVEGPAKYALEIAAASAGSDHGFGSNAIREGNAR